VLTKIKKKPNLKSKNKQLQGQWVKEMAADCQIIDQHCLQNLTAVHYAEKAGRLDIS
jgi:hypothetical protein